MAPQTATLRGLANFEAQQDRLDQARTLYQQSLELKDCIGDIKAKSPLR